MEAYLVKSENLRPGMHVLNRGDVISIHWREPKDEPRFLSVRFVGSPHAFKFMPGSQLWVEKNPPARGRGRGENIGGVTID